ncbi:MAG: hypothetical protein U9O94_01995 [Nanoarchaeota archaeon]|nr:hypothetical protein [Nanoarchaeota archaeon]
MPTKNIQLELPIAMLEKINEVIQETDIFDDHHDVIVHAITDLLEDYGKGGVKND